MPLAMYVSALYCILFQCLNGSCSKQCPCITSILLCKYLFMQTLTPLFFICLPHQFHNHASPQPTATNTNITDFIKVLQLISSIKNKKSLEFQFQNRNVIEQRDDGGELHLAIKKTANTLASAFHCTQKVTQYQIIFMAYMYTSIHKNKCVEL